MLATWNTVEAESEREDHIALDRASALGSKSVGGIAEFQSHLQRPFCQDSAARLACLDVLTPKPSDLMKY